MRSLASVLGLLLCTLPLASQTCGDCDQNGSVSILDALCASQDQIGLKQPPLSGLARTLCDVDDNGTVSVIDALLIAQCSVGVLGSPCGLGCDGLRVEVTTPIGPVAGDVVVSYRVFDEQSNPIDLEADFSTDAGASWSPLTLAAGSMPLMGRPSAPPPIGVDSTLVWDTPTDRVGLGCVQGALVRLRPFDAGAPGLAGFSGTFDVINLSDTFTSGPLFPGGLPVQEHAQVLLADGRVLLCGGTRDRATPSDEAFLFDPLSGTISQTGSMNEARIAHAVTRLATGHVLVAGGLRSVAPFAVSDTVEWFDPTSETWTLSPVPLVEPMRAAGIAYFEARNEILLTAGLVDDGFGDVITNEAYRYVPDVANPAASQSGLYNASRFLRYEATLTTLPGVDGVLGTMDDLALAYGGSGMDPADPPGQVLPGFAQVHGFHTLGDAEIFDPGVDQWFQVNDNVYYKDQVQLQPGSSRIGPRREHAAVLLDDGSVLLVGGHSEIDEDPSSGAPMVTTQDGRLVFAERFVLDPLDFTASTIDPAGTIDVVRGRPVATVTACGDVLLSGGYDYFGVDQPVLRETLRFDPASVPASAWTSAADLGEARWLHGVTTLPDGRLFVAGGEAGDITTPFGLSTTELYLP